ncbi:DNA translocase FtsK [Patescibacteria group bacterium]|nr:MAG: DNA translocase FtsK [Patescibacteria group bacterium]
MARKKSSKKKSEKSGFTLPSLSLNLRPETANSIRAILTLFIGVIFLFAPLGKGGAVGRFLYDSLSTFLGVGYFLVPISLFFLGAGLFRDREHRGFVGVRVFGTSILFLAGIGLLSLVGNLGGILGGWVSGPFVSLFDFTLALILLSGIALVGGLLTLDTPLSVPKFAAPSFLSFMRKKKDDTEDDFEITGVPEEEPSQTPEKIERKPEKKQKPEKIEEVEAGFVFSPTGDTYNPPPVSLLDRDKGKPDSGDIKANANLIKRTLQNFGITVEMDEVSVGPTVTRYALKPAEGVRLQKILSLQNNLELALGATHPIRIEAPIPGKSLVGIEVSNMKKATVGLGSLISEEKFQNNQRPLTIALGRDIVGTSHFANIAKMPHLLIAGATGAGKSVSIHALITSLLYRNGPAALRFIMIDPKRVELTAYNPIPHLLTPVITDPKKAILALKWAGKEMERRYNLLEKHAVRDIQSYHENIVAKSQKSKSKDDEEQVDQMPYIVIVLDELADIMQTYPRELESAVVRLAQMSRAVGIHLILSTQRPSVNVITGLIKANVPARIALQVASQIDSRTILDSAGAEKLLGAGDMLYQSADMPKPHRIQTAFISENEVKEIVEYIRKHNEPTLDGIALSGPATETPNAIFSASLEEDDNDDELFQEAKQIVEEAGKASTSYLQRKLRIGYARAARLMDVLEEKGVIGPADGARPRDVLTNAGTTPEEEDNDTV